MATPPAHDLQLKSAPRKLPIKRKAPSSSAATAVAAAAPNSLVSVPLTDPLAVSNGCDAVNEDEYDEEDEEEDDEDVAAAALGAATPAATAGGAPFAGDTLRTPPPFKFHRIWSESDEIRFLQGLLGCWSQGMVFPRDLNLFYDRFSESMPQPYTRSQLSEKLRRLRKKFRVMSARIARGQVPSRLAPHDRDLLHLCTRLWHPSYAASSPFSSPDASTAPAAPASGSGSSGGNKRRRSNPRVPSGRGAAAEDASPAQLVLCLPPTSSSLSDASMPAPPAASGNRDNCTSDGDKKLTDVNLRLVKEEPQIAISNHYNLHIDEPNLLVAKAVLEVFDGCLKELQGTLTGKGLPQLHGGKSDLEKRWKELRLAEMNALSQRSRLILKNLCTKLK